jgi:hypothetical protein
VGIVRFELEPQYKQHVSSPYSPDYPFCPELREYSAGEKRKTIPCFRALIGLLFDLI